MFSRNTLAVDIGSFYIKMVYGKKLLGELHINEFGIITTPNFSFKNGYLLDIKLISSKIKEFLIFKKIKPNNISFVIHSTDILLRNFEIPVMNKKNIRDAVEWEMGKCLKGTINDYYLSIESIGRNNKTVETLGVIVPRNIINQYELLCSLLGLKIKYIDIAVKCALRFYKGKSNEFIVMDVGHSSARISLYSKDKIFANREIICEIDKTKEKTVFKDNEIFGVSKSYLKHSVGINNIFKNFEEMTRYYESIDREKRIKSIYLIGGGSTCKEISEYMMENFQGGKELLGDVDYKKVGFNNIFKENIRLYINAIGLLLRK